ncbi:MAG: hypothetical protein M1511_08770, partial [Deltaproteobacteria bacterium]|nr:hypothetical protein [Deltaproteobacteria bacterium]
DTFAFRHKRDITYRALISAWADEAMLKASQAGVKNVVFPQNRLWIPEARREYDLLLEADSAYAP